MTLPSAFPEGEFLLRKEISSRRGKYPLAKDNILFRNTLVFFERRF
jgi:hypothetical protein